jgi:hypothetical protein
MTLDPLLFRKEWQVIYPSINSKEASDMRSWVQPCKEDRQLD